MQTKIKVRQESKFDIDAVSNTIIAAYKDVAYSNKREQLMVDRLRKSNAFIPELSIVAENENENIVGHILLTKIYIQNQNHLYEGLALAPLSIKPEFQNKGIGGRLIIESHLIAKELGHKYIVVLGHSKYYPKFGYELTSKYHIEVPIKVHEENCMIISLAENGLSGVSGMVVFSKEFFE